MKMVISILVIVLGFAGGAAAGPSSPEAVFDGPTQQEYEAAMIVVRAYLEKEKLRAAAEAGEAGEAYAEAADSQADPFSPPMDADMEETLEALPAEPKPTVTVFGKGKLEAASVAALTAGDADGKLMVGYPDKTNQEDSGRLVFDEQVQNNPSFGLCGFEFVHDGADNKLTLQTGCSSVAKPSQIATFSRSGPIMFERSLGIGGTLFNGQGSGGTTGGGLLAVSFLGNNQLTCNNVCNNHAMTCAHAVDLTSFAYSTCAAAAGDVQLQLCMCSN